MNNKYYKNSNNQKTLIKNKVLNNNTSKKLKKVLIQVKKLMQIKNILLKCKQFIKKNSKVIPKQQIKINQSSQKQKKNRKL